MDSLDKSNLDDNPYHQCVLRDLFQRKMKEADLTCNPEKTIERYFKLSIQPELSELDLEELALIMDKACGDENLMALIEIIDLHMNEMPPCSNLDYIENIDSSRASVLDRILNPKINEVTKALVAKEDKNRSLEWNSGETLTKGLSFPILVHLIQMKRSLVAVSVTALGIICSLPYIEDIVSSRSGSLMTGWEELSERNTSETVETASEIQKSMDLMPNPHACQAQRVGWISPSLNGHITAYGSKFSNREYSASHDFLPPGSRIELQSETSTKRIKVKVNDRSNPESTDASLLVSYSAADALGVIEAGIAPVTITQVEVDKSNIQSLTEQQKSKLQTFKQLCNSIVSFNPG